ncbi:MAG: FAD-binding oxidoreductase [Rhodobiaceae bacterium]|nr:FAD-binding oxidoreductase [Rhodobiaceae bacterium]MCC0054780.1 FAD-binding oxidoreductase [Rhodobiaceae bacterium]
MNEPRYGKLTRELMAAFADIVGPANALTEAADTARYLHDWRERTRAETPLVLRPGNTDEVSRIMKIADRERIPVVPQGGGTGLAGGHLPSEGLGEIIISLERMNRLRDVDTAGMSLTAEAGMTLQVVQDAAENAGQYFGLRIASQGSCMIGGNLSTNAGGIGVIAYGNARSLCLGLEVVLADGRIWNGLGALRKDNTGYDLRDLFIGAEGTLGIITAATLKLHAKPARTVTALAGVASPDAALTLLSRLIKSAGPGVTAAELMARRAIEFTLRHAADVRDPMEAPHPWYLLTDLSSTSEDSDLEQLLEEVLSGAIEAGEVEDAVVASSLAQAESLWALREMMSEAQKPEGASLKHDVSVPVANVPAFIDEAVAAVLAVDPGCRPVPFGHIGDGNIHFNISQPAGGDTASFLAQRDALHEAVHTLVLKYGGSISAEHGIGSYKRDLLAKTKDPVALAMMRAIKRTLDPSGILNPGKIL